MLFVIALVIFIIWTMTSCVLTTVYLWDQLDTEDSYLEFINKGRRNFIRVYVKEEEVKSKKKARA